jgi:DNA-binding NtrC family response regulator
MAQDVGSDSVPILAVDDDAFILKLMDEILTESGYRCVKACNGEEALSRMESEEFPVVITDVAMPGIGGMELLSQIREHHPTVDVVLTTGVGTIEIAVEAMKRGARDFITKPFSPESIRDVVSQLLRARHGAASAESYDIGDGSTIVGKSSAMRRLYAMIDSFRQSSANVLICGESGTGKELIARALHYGGSTSGGPFVPVNCAGVPRTLAESQFFGHVKGAFTGAVSDEIGFFRKADGGTLFLDEVTEVPLDFQSMLLRAVQEQQVVPIGSTDALDVSVRVVAATNRGVEGAVDGAHLRPDLYYRLAVVLVTVPPLRERVEDIPLLAAHVLARCCEKQAGETKAFTDEAMEVMAAHVWPGNVRELENVVESSFAVANGPWIDVGDLPQHVRSPKKKHPTGQVRTFEQMEKQAIVDALEATGGSKTKTAEVLGINRQRLYRKLRKYDIQ